jgi:hypothetical protein
MLLEKMRTEKKDVVNMDTRRRFVPTSNTIMKMVEKQQSGCSNEPEEMNLEVAPHEEAPVVRP